jgi:hypothetical protein
MVKAENNDWYKGSVYVNERKIKMRKLQEKNVTTVKNAPNASVQQLLKTTKSLTTDGSKKGFFPSTHILLLDDNLSSKRSTRRRSVLATKNESLVFGDKNKKVEPLDFIAERKELDYDNTWWKPDTAFGEMTLDVMADCGEHFEELLKKGNELLFERIFELYGKMLVSIPQYKKAATENNLQLMKSIENQQLKLIEQVCIILDEDVVPKINGLIVNETSTTLIKLYKLYWETMKKEREAVNDLKKKGIIPERTEQLGIRAIMSNVRGAGKTTNAASSKDKEFYDLPDGNTQMMIQVTECAFALDDKVELCFSLYSKKEKKIISEEFLVSLPHDNCSLKADDVRKIIIQDIGADDFKNELFLIVRIYRKGSILQERKSKENQKSLEFKRPYGCAVLELDPATVSSLMSGDIFNMDPLPVYVPTKEECFYNLHKSIIKTKKSDYEEAPKTEVTKGISLVIQSQIGDYEDVTDKLPDWKDIRTCKLMKFPKVVSPLDKRNDIYITLEKGNFKFADVKNIMIECRVVFKPPEEAQHRTPESVKCIVGQVDTDHSAEMQSSHYVSSVYYHNKTPEWNETFKVNIEPENLDRATVVFLFTNCPSRHGTVKTPFAIGAWKMTNKKGLLNLTNGNANRVKGDKNDKGDKNEMKKSGYYTVYVYNYSKQLENEIYNFSELHELRTKLSTKNTLYIKHNIISTRVTQNEHLRNLLSWTDVNAKSKKDILHDFIVGCQMEEKVTFLREIFDSMFTILDQHDDEEIAVLVYQATIEIIGSLVLSGNLVTQRALERYKEILDQYIENHLTSLQVQKWFLHFLLHHLSSSKDKNMDKVIAENIKALDYLFRFIVQSRKKYEEAIEKGEKLAADIALEMTSFYIPKTTQNAGKEEKGTEENTAAEKKATSDESVPDKGTPSDISPNGQENGRQNITSEAKSNSVQEEALNDGIPVTIVEEQAEVYEVVPKDEFQKKILYLLDRIYELMNSKEMIRSRGNIFKYAGSLFDSLVEIFDPVQVGYVSLRFLSEIPKDEALLVKYKLDLITQMVRGKVFKQLESRKIILPKIVEELQFHFNRDPEERQRCIQIFLELIHSIQRIYNQGNLDQIKDSLYIIFSVVPQAKEALEQIGESINQLNKLIEEGKEEQKKGTEEGKNDPKKKKPEQLEQDLQPLERLRTDLIVALLCIVYMYRTEELMEYHCKCDENTATGMSIDTIKHFFYLYDVFLSANSGIPDNFISFNVLLYKSILSSMVTLAKYLKLNFLEEGKFNFEIWDSLFKFLFQFVFAPYIQLEGATRFKKDKIMAQGGTDFRKDSLDLIWNIWQSMGPMQEHFVPSIINPIMRIFDIRNVELHQYAVKLYFGVLKRGYATNKSLEPCLGVTQGCIIERTIDDMFRQSFVESLAEKFEADSELKSPGGEFIDRVNSTMEDVVKVQRSDEALKTQAYIQVMDSLKSNKNMELYLKYVHKLSDMHREFGNHIEAALSLKLHYDKLTWDNTKELPIFSEEYGRETSKVRKEKMAKTLIDLFDKGKDWERAIQLCKELRAHYEKTYAYNKIKPLLEKEGELYTSIMTKKRFNAAYFYVRYYGQGFKAIGLEGEYIHRGKELENHVEFANKLSANYPGSKVHFKQPSDELDNDPGMHLYVYTVVPSDDKELANVFEHRDYSISPKIRRYASMNNIKYVTVTRRYRESNEETNNEYKDMHREIKFFVLEDTFPNIKRMMRIVDVKYLHLNPLENAMKDIEDKVNELQDSVISHILDERPDTNELSMLLNGTIDAAVNGGILKYLDAFFSQEYKDKHPDQKETLSRFRKALFAQLDVLKEGLKHRRKHVTGKALQLNDHLESMYERLKKQMATI